jgi:hypothetical protein
MILAYFIGANLIVLFLKVTFGYMELDHEQRKLP